MKKFISIIFVAIMVFSVSLFGCNSNGTEQMGAAEYTIMYNDGAANHTLKVKSGDLYEIEQPLPSRTGYDFIGLYDAEVGGTQYVSKNGLSLAPFSEKSNIILYPQFKAKQYNLVLNYGEATVSGETNVMVDYGADIPILPCALSIPDKPYMNFTGWYTNEKYNKVKLTDEKGVSVRQFDEQLAKLADEQNRLKLYTEFAAQTYKVKFYSDDGKVELKNTIVEHGALLSEFASNIIDRGLKVITWSENAGGSATNLTGSTVTSDINLYACEYATTATATFKENTKQLITEDSETNNYFDTVALNDLFGRSLQEFTALGFNKIRFDISVSISEIIQGYQEVYISNTHGSDGAIWSKTNIEHGGAIGVTSSVWKHTYSVTLDLSDCNNLIYILYGAHGDGEDDWYRHAVELKMEIYKI